MADNNTVVPGMEVPRLNFSKTWESPDDFPTFEPDEVQVRADMQLLHDETKDYLNNVLAPEIEQVKSGDFVKVAGVASFNGRKGEIIPQSGDYTAEMVGAADQSLEVYNQYWWKLTETVKYGYVETRTTAGTVAVSSLHASPARTLSVADTVSVDRATGAVSLVSPGAEVVKLYYNGEAHEIVTSDGRDAKAALLGKYISGLYGSEAAFCVTSSTEFGFVEEEVYIDDENDENYGNFVYLNKIYATGMEQIGSEQVALPQEVTLVHSEDRNAYPDSGSDAEYFYEYLGIPFSNLPVAARMETGTYVGTGKNGANYKNSLTFSFQPKFVVITGFADSLTFFFIRGSSRYTLTSLESRELPVFSDCLCNWDGNTLTWWYSYEGNTGIGQPQANTSGTTYYFVAFG